MRDVENLLPQNDHQCTNQTGALDLAFHKAPSSPEAAFRRRFGGCDGTTSDRDTVSIKSILRTTDISSGWHHMHSKLSRHCCDIVALDMPC